MTIGDCWGIENYNQSVDYKYGVSAVIINNQKGRDLFDSIDSCKIGFVKEVPLYEIKKYNKLAFISERNWRRSYRSKYFLQKLEQNPFSIATKLTLLLKVEGVVNLTIDVITKEQIDISWGVVDENHYNGIIIEELVNKEWRRIRKVDDKIVRKTSIKNIDGKFQHEFRVKSFFYDESVALYSEYEYIKCLLSRDF